MVGRGVIVIAILLLAGCAAQPSGKGVLVGPGPGEPGTLHGVVVDEAIRPVPNATVQLVAVNGTATATGRDGSFAIPGLAAGAYQVEIRKDGFYPATVGAVVETAKPSPLLQVQLVSNPITRPYYSAFAVDGFIECGSSLLDPCAFANQASGQNLTDDISQGSLTLSSNASLIQSELVWSSTQAVAPQLSFVFSAFNPACNPDNYWVLNITQGESPLLLRVNESLVREQWVGGNCPLDFSVSSSGPLCTARMVVPVVNATVSELCAGATIQQRYTLYLHAFYNYLPPQDWRFTTDNVVPPPPELQVPN
jgi:hypothetical protein